MMRSLFSMLRPNRRMILWALITLFCAEVFPFLYPWVFAHILDGKAWSAHPEQLHQWLLLYGLLVIGHSLFLYLRSVFGQYLSIDTTHSLRLRVFEHLRNLPVSYFQKNAVGTIMSRTTNDVDTIGGIFGDGILELVSNVVLLLFAVVFMLWQDWRLALATLVFFPVMLLISSWFRTHFRSLQTRYRAELASLSAYLQEALNGVGIIQVYRRQARLQVRFRSRNFAYTQVARQYAHRYASFFPLVQTFSDLSLLTCYAAGLYLIGHGSLTTGTMVAFAWYASIYSRPLRDLSDRMNTLQTGLAAGDRVREFLEIPVEICPTKQAILHRDGSCPALQCQQVFFAYDPSKPVLQDFNLSVMRGQTVALVGATGCGKSTALQLMVGFIQPTQGRSLLWGADVCSIHPVDRVKTLAWLGQDPFLFPGTIAENICMALPFEEGRFLDVCARAQLHSMLASLPLGRATKVGTGGQELSTGQRQLVAYARTLYQDPEILLLDEPSASIDATTEHLLHLALRELLRGRTALLVSHRIASIAACDEVHFIQGGRVQASGPHHYLLQTHPEYARVFGHQAGRS